MASDNLPENLQAARYLCARQWPYLSSGLWAVTPVSCPDLPAHSAGLGVDKYWRLYFRPEINHEVPVIATMLFHEMCHLLFNHPLRSENIKDLDSNAWNVCADASINGPAANEPHIKFWQGHITPATLKQKDGLTAEEYYDNLPVKNVVQVECGSGAGGGKRSWEQGQPGGQDKDGNENAPGLTQGEGELLRRHIANEIKQAGNAPAEWQRWADAILEPKINWKKELFAVIRQSCDQIRGKLDYSYQRPSRRQYQGFIMPSTFSPVPRAAGVIDVSGSIDQAALSGAMGEINGMLKVCGQGGMPWYVTDAAVHSSKRVFKASQIQLTGGGGTDMRIGIDAATSVPRFQRPHIVVVLTDGFTPWPDRGPDTKVIIVLIKTSITPDQCPGWAKVIKVD